MNHQNEPPNDLQTEARLSRILRQAPGYRAPKHLAPKVLAAIRSRESMVWWRHSFAQWPVGWKWAFSLLAPLLMAMFTGAFWTLSAHWDASAALDHLEWWRKAASFWQVGSAIFNVGEILVRQFLNAWLVGAGVVCLAMYLALAGLGTAFLRFAWRKATL